jgi:hypothetical protein
VYLRKMIMNRGPAADYISRVMMSPKFVNTYFIYATGTAH